MSSAGLPDGVLAFRPRRGSESWVSAGVVAGHFQVSVRTVQRWRQQGCPSISNRGTVRYRLSAIETWLGGQD
jgi:phage terminase Nu1 subunit (DNA packaging protein)